MGVRLAEPQADGAFLVGVNETLNRTTAADLADTLVRATSTPGDLTYNRGWVG